MLVFQKNWREHIRKDPQKGCIRAGIDFKWLVEVVAEINLYLPDDWRMTRSENNFRIDIVGGKCVSLIGHAFRTGNEKILNIIDTVWPTNFSDTKDLKHVENRNDGTRMGLKAGTKKKYPEIVVPNLYFFRPSPAKLDSPLFARQYERVKKNKTGKFGGDQYHRIHPLTKAGLDLMHFRWVKWDINGNTCLVDTVPEDYHGKNFWEIIPELDGERMRRNAEAYLKEYEKILKEYEIHPKKSTRSLPADSFQIEYKFLVPESDVSAVYEIIDGCIEELDFSVVEKPKRATEQIDDYYDDANFSLHKSGASFRVRKKANDNLLVSLKKRKPIEDIYACSGLYERIEEEAVITLSQENDLQNGKPVNILPYRLLPFITKNMGVLQHVMTVKNQRKAFVLQDDSLRKIYLRLDSVSYNFFNSASPKNTFFELEIQSKEASKELTRQLAEKISVSLGLLPSGQSKYERGISLLKTGIIPDKVKKKVIIDTDCGVDDALALILALKSEELDVLAITTVSGNVHVDQVTRNVSRILEVLPYEENLILARGADRPLKRERTEAGSVHGEDGLGDIQDYGSSKPVPLDDRPAWKVICDLAREYPQKITMITLGPLTNLAIAMKNEPDSVCHLHELVSMGGVFFDVGNVGPDAEFNVMADPDAARNVVRFCRDSCRKIPVDQAGRTVDLPENPSQQDFEMVKGFVDRDLQNYPDIVPLTFVGLDVSHRVALRRHTLDHAVKSCPGNHVLEFVQKISRKYMDFYCNNEGLNGCYLHDPLAVAFVINPSLLRIENHIIRVETQGAFTSGMIFPDDRPTTNWAWKNPAEKVIGVARQVEREAFEEFFLNRLME